jgi:hypothetical protein
VLGLARSGGVVTIQVTVSEADEDGSATQSADLGWLE